jgi:hypothetical protein
VPDPAVDTLRDRLVAAATVDTGEQDHGAAGASA